MMSSRPMAVAGLFYPENAGVLRDLFNHWWHRPNSLAEPLQDSDKKELPRALILPHAGYQYSGEAAAKGYRLWRSGKERIQTVILLGPAHRVYFEGVTVLSHSAVNTPLGSLKQNLALRDDLLNHFDQLHISDQSQAEEHALEVHFPFLKSLLPDVSVLPLLIGDVSSSYLTDILRYLWRMDSVYFVISSDLSHFLAYDQANTVDHETASIIETGHADMLSGHRACGYKGIQGLLGAVADRAYRLVQLSLTNSGDTGGDKHRVVGYGAWALYDSYQMSQQTEKHESV